MTCQELRLYFEDPQRADAEFRVETEHLAHCADCARFVSTQRQLGVKLRRLREAVPQFPVGLDSTVLANYRRAVANRTSSSNAATASRRIAILCMTAAAIVLVAGVVFFLKPKVASPISGPRRVEAVITSQSSAGSAIARLSGPTKRRRSHLAVGRRRALPGVAAPGFRSLMYCDELSCGELMELIRVQLPSASIGLEAASTAAGGTVMADVLVGPDGIARGIRIVE